MATRALDLGIHLTTLSPYPCVRVWLRVRCVLTRMVVVLCFLVLCCHQNDPTRRVSSTLSGRVKEIAVKEIAAIKKKTTGVVYEGDSRVIQLSIAGNDILVSTNTRVTIINTDTLVARPVGTKSRDGAFGACFGVSPETGDRVIYSARPGCAQPNPTQPVPTGPPASSSTRGSTTGPRELVDSLLCEPSPCSPFAHLAPHRRVFLRNKPVFFVPRCTKGCIRRALVVLKLTCCWCCCTCAIALVSLPGRVCGLPTWTTGQ
jgi:hypothetical protein